MFARVVKKPGKETASAAAAKQQERPRGADHCQEPYAEARANPRFQWSFTKMPFHPPGREPSSQPLPLQRKLAVGSVNDPLEQEADRVADQVMRMPEPQIAPASAPPQVSRKCASCEAEEEDKLQKKEAAPATAAMTEAPASVHEVLRSPGQPLDAATRAFFEPRFKYDFSGVRVHVNAAAAGSASEVDAVAYTVGIREGKFAPHSLAGKRLLAHELTHVVQQARTEKSVSDEFGAERRLSIGSLGTCERGRVLAHERPSLPVQLQKQPETKQEQTPKEKPKARQDIVILGEDWEGSRELSAILAHGGGVIQVNSIDEAAKALAKIDRPIGTLYFVTHSLADGALKFGKSEGFIKAADIASKLKGSIPADKAPQVVDFRGCSVGNSPKAMESIRIALGAQSVVAGNCYAVIWITHAFIKIGPEKKETDITNAVQVTDKTRPLFNRLFRSTRRKFLASFESREGCLVTKSEEDYFAAGGRFVALWFNPDFKADWVKGKSICYAEAVHETVDPAKPAATIKDCRVITVSAPQQQPEEDAPEPKAPAKKP